MRLEASAIGGDAVCGACEAAREERRSACPGCAKLRETLAALLNELRDLRAAGALDAEDVKGYDFAGVIADAERVLGVAPAPEPSAYCEVCEIGDAEWVAPIGGGGRAAIARAEGRSS